MRALQATGLLVVAGVVSVVAIRSAGRLSSMPQPSAPAPVLLASADGPFVLGPTPLRISLKPTGKGSLSAALNRLSPTERVFVVLRGPTTDTQPGVPFQVFLDMGDGQRSDDEPHLIGTLNFYAALPRSSAGSDTDRYESYDVTDAARALKRLRRLRDTTELTIAPVGTPAAAARPTIERVSLVRQAS